MTYEEAAKHLNIRRHQIKPSDFGFIAPAEELLLTKVRNKITKQNNDQLLELMQLKTRSDLEVYVFENSSGGIRYPQIDYYLKDHNQNEF